MHMVEGERGRGTTSQGYRVWRIRRTGRHGPTMRMPRRGRLGERVGKRERDGYTGNQSKKKSFQRCGWMVGHFSARLNWSYGWMGLRCFMMVCRKGSTQHCTRFFLFSGSSFIFFVILCERGAKWGWMKRWRWPGVGRTGERMGLEAAARKVIKRKGENGWIWSCSSAPWHILHVKSTWFDSICPFFMICIVLAPWMEE